MSFDPEKNAPRKLDMEQLQKGLSKKQMDKVQYECDLMRMEPQRLLQIAPHLFNENVTAANTTIEPEPYITQEEDGSYNDDYDYSSL